MVGVVDGFAVDNAIGFGLGGNPLQPLALWRAPGARCQNALQSAIHALVIGQKGITHHRLANIANDAGGNLLVGQLAPSGGEIGFAKAGLIQFPQNLAQLFAG